MIPKTLSKLETNKWASGHPCKKDGFGVSSQYTKLLPNGSKIKM